MQLLLKRMLFFIFCLYMYYINSVFLGTLYIRRRNQLLREYCKNDVGIHIRDILLNICKCIESKLLFNLGF